jgi:hypothetical protein
MTRLLRNRCLPIVLLAGMALAVRSSAADRSDSQSEGFGPFRVIVERNIFDPNRLPLVRPVETGPVELSEPAETVDLLGTWISNRQTIAFVEGSRPALSGTLVPGGEVGSWRVAGIENGRVVLETNGDRLEWPVGQRIRRSDEGGWVLAGSAVVSAVSTSPAAFSSSTSGGGDGDSDLLQKLRERRQRENAP